MKVGLELSQLCFPSLGGTATPTVDHSFMVKSNGLKDQRVSNIWGNCCFS